MSWEEFTVHEKKILEILFDYVWGIQYLPQSRIATLKSWRHWWFCLNINQYQVLQEQEGIENRR